MVAVLGATVTVCSGIQGLYNFHENSIKYRLTAETLKHEKYMFLTRSGIYQGSNNPLNLLVKRVESIIANENINWAQLNSHDPAGKVAHESVSPSDS